MTVVVACRLLKTVAVFADCRVSYTDGSPEEVDDNLQKIYPIDKRMILGFSGPLSGAYQVIQGLRRNLGKYSKRPVASNLQRDVERWIRYEYRRIEKPEDRKGLSFILVTVEPLREARSKWRSSDGEEIPKPKWFGADPPEMQILKLRPSTSRPKELVKEEKGMFKIIGVADDIQDVIQDKIQQFFGFAFKQPNQQARVLADVLMLTLMEKQISKVGGLFQVALLSANGIKWLAYGDSIVAMNIIDGRYIQQAKNSRTVPLKTIWEWWEEWTTKEKPRLGSVGIFEDPDLRKAAQTSGRRAKRG
jgi:hypothetical protein